MTFDFDLVVIGSGPAGERGAAQAAYFGKKVALVERAELGGACVHKGTVPSKSLRESALYLSGIRTRGIAGLIREDTGPVRVQSLLAHKEKVCADEKERVRENLRRHGIELVVGDARLTGPHRVDVGGRELTAEFILLATGSRPFRPSSVPFDGASVLDADDILTIDFLPGSLTVIGAGVIGCEYASMFAALGVDVTLVEPRDRVLPFVDGEVGAALMASFEALGIDLRLGTAMDACAVHDGVVVATLSDGSEVRSDKLLFAAGRSGNTDGLGLEAVGLAANRRGQVVVDAQFRTSVPSIFAAGDVVGFPALASTSMDQGRVAMCHAFGLTYKQGLANRFPYGIYTVPECSMIGLTEEDAAREGLAFETGRAAFKDNPRARINGGSGGVLKLVFAVEDKRLLGVHIVGDHAAELVHAGMMVMQVGGTIDAFIDAVFNYPTLSEAYKYAAYDGLGRLARRTAP